MERVDLVQVHDKQPLRCWRDHGSQSSHVTTIRYGRLGDGRWWAERTGRLADVDDKQHGGCVFSGDLAETLALRLAYSWMREGQWWPAPARFGPDGLPMDGLPWVRRGGEWALDTPSGPVA